MVVDRDGAQALLDQLVGGLDGVLVGGVGARPGALLAVVLEETVDLGERVLLLAQLGVGLDDLVLEVRGGGALGILGDQAAIRLDGGLELTLLEIGRREALEHVADELFLAELVEVLVGLVHLAGVGEEADEVLEGFVLELEGLHERLAVRSDRAAAHGVGDDGLHLVDGGRVVTHVVVAPGELDGSCG